MVKRLKYINIDPYTKSLDTIIKSGTLLENCRDGSGIAYAQNELTGIEKTLRVFISDAGYNIREVIYPALKSGRFKNNIINVPDLNYILSVYMEYNDGMYEFVLKSISEMLNSELDNDVIGTAYNHIQQAVRRDKTFISSIAESTDNTLSDAFKNVEAVVDVFETFDRLRTNIADLGERIPCEDVSRKKAIIASFFLYVKSSIEFEKFMATNIIQTYDLVINSISNGPSRLGRDDAPKFKLI